MARLYADEDFDHRVVEQLRRLGHDVRTVQEAGQANRKTPDSDVLSFAAADNRAVLTYNRRNFIRLHQQAQGHAGIIVCTRDVDAVALAVRIDEAVAHLPTLDDRLIRIARPLQP